MGSEDLGGQTPTGKAVPRLFFTLCSCCSHGAFAVLEPRRAFCGLGEPAQARVVGRSEVRRFFLPKKGKS